MMHPFTTLKKSGRLDKQYKRSIYEPEQRVKAVCRLAIQFSAVMAQYANAGGSGTSEAYA